MERLKHVVQLNIVLGAWLIVAPLVMGYSFSTIELGNDIVLGVWLIGCAWWILAAGVGQMGASALELIGGVWLVAAPFVFHYQRMSRPFGNDVGVGVLSVMVSATAIWMLASRQRRVA
jgi:hypothetical protein